MRLSTFITEHTQQIMLEWEAFAKTLTPAADNMSDLQLKDHIVEILQFIAKDIETPQTPSEQVTKSQGGSDNTAYKKDTAAETHGGLRHGSGFDIVQMVAEYRALRTSIIKLWTQYKKMLDPVDVVQLTRFNEAIDQALTESVVRFMEKVDYSKDLLLGILSHDIRTPLSAIKMSAALLPKIGSLNEKQTALVEQMDNCSVRANHIVTSLLDLTQASIGTGLPIVRQPMDMGSLAQEIVNEIRAQFPERTTVLEIMGDTRGEWDSTRQGQVYSNLISNAIQYSDKDTPIQVIVKGEDQEVIVSVHNEGEPIPPLRLATLFDSFTRGDANDGATNTLNLGLGLFITREIVLAHGGTLKVSSTAEKGTMFVARFPKKALVS